LILGKNPGDTMHLTILRGGKTMDVVVTLEERKS
jgi:S1-C subfamily serine protease